MKRAWHARIPSGARPFACTLFDRRRQSMRAVKIGICVTAVLAGAVIVAQAQRQRLNPVIALVEQGKPVFGVYAPSAFPPGGRRGAPPPPDAPVKQPLDLAREALAYKAADYLFNGSMEG